MTVSRNVPAHLIPVIQHADQMIHQGGIVHFKWTCAKCGSRQTFDTPNTLYRWGQCEQCQHTNDLEQPEAKVDFLLIMGSQGPRN